MDKYIPSKSQFYSQDNRIFNSFYIEEHLNKDSDTTVIVIIVDALSDDFFRKYYHLTPNLKSVLENGAYYLKNTTCLPSCTGISHTNILTGVGADQHNIAGMNFINSEKQIHFNGLNFDNETLFDNNVSSDIKTIFENNPKVKSASVWNFVRRGATVFIPYKKTFYRHAEKLTMEQLDKGARIITIWYPLLDPLGHRLGVHHPFRVF